MHKPIFLLFIFLCLSTCCLAQKNENKATLSFLEAPADWSKESFALPPSFAPGISFSGIEQVRFAPGWADSSSVQFWTYSFAWYIAGKQDLTEKRLKELMQSYFTGLSQSVGQSKGMAAEKITNSTASFTLTKKGDGRQSFEGKIQFFDVFFTKKPIGLQVKVKETYCPQVDKHLIVFFLSPQRFDSQVWKVFDQVRSARDCKELPQASQTTYGTRPSEHYELLLPKGEVKQVLILFPGYGENPEDIKTEFNIVEPAISQGIGIAFMKFNRHLWLSKQEKIHLSTLLEQMLKENALKDKSIYIGGFSSGGNVALLVSNHLMKQEKGIKLKGVFIIDSPVDLLGLYENSKKNIARNVSQVSVEESKMVVNLFESTFGKPEQVLDQYEEHGVYTQKTHNTNNLSSLKDVKIRLYTEPDTLWWKQNRGYAYQEMNAYFIKSLSEELSQKIGNKVEYIPTQNRGYRSNGDRHPHSWSIVEVDELLQWIREQKD
jgi:hypothetical protein